MTEAFLTQRNVHHGRKTLAKELLDTLIKNM